MISRTHRIAESSNMFCQSKKYSEMKFLSLQNIKIEIKRSEVQTLSTISSMQSISLDFSTSKEDSVVANTR